MPQSEQPSRELSHEERLALWREQRAREGNRPIRAGVHGIVKFLEEGGTYGVGVNGTWIQVVGTSADGQESIAATLFYSQREQRELTPEKALDLAETLDVYFAFPGRKPEKIDDYLESLRLDSRLIVDEADRSEADSWLHAKWALARKLMDPDTWSLSHGRGARGSFVRQGVEWRLKEFNRRWRKGRARLVSLDECPPMIAEPEATPEAEVIARDLLRVQRAWIYANEGLTDRDKMVRALFIEGRKPADICRILGYVDAAGKVDMSPWTSYRQKMLRRTPPKGIL